MSTSRPLGPDPPGETPQIKSYTKAFLHETDVAIAATLSQQANGADLTSPCVFARGSRELVALPRVAPASSDMQVARKAFADKAMNFEAEGEALNSVKTKIQRAPNLEQCLDGYPPSAYDALNPSSGQGYLCAVPPDDSSRIASGHYEARDSGGQQSAAEHRQNALIFGNPDDLHFTGVNMAPMAHSGNNGNPRSMVSTACSDVKDTEMREIGSLNVAAGNLSGQAREARNEFDFATQSLSIWVYFAMVITSWPTRTWIQLLTETHFLQSVITPKAPVGQVFKTEIKPANMKCPPPGEHFYPLGDPG